MDNSNTSESSEEEPSLIEAQHDISPSEPQPINLSVLSVEEKNFKDGEFKLRPQEKFPAGYAYGVQINGSLDQVFCYIFENDGNSYGWCRCETFGRKKMCEHLLVAFKWERGLLKPENQEIALAAKEKLLEMQED